VYKLQGGQRRGAPRYVALVSQNSLPRNIGQRRDPILLSAIA
jgi:hypothetical protein